MSVPAVAAEMGFTYNTANQEYKIYGFEKRETYDVAIHIGAEMEGKKVVRLEAPIPVNADQIENLSGWISTELKLSGKLNDPDLASVEASFEEGVLTASFAEPITIPAGGVYVGYTFKVFDLTQGADGEWPYPKMPVACIDCDIEGSLYIHSNRTQLKWTSYTERLGGAGSPMVVTLEGDFAADAAGVSIPEKTYSEVGQKGMMHVDIVNHGSTPISSVYYSYSCSNVSGGGTYEFESPVPAEYGSKASFDIEVPAISELGTYPFSLSLDKVNGVENTDMMKDATGNYVVAPFVPKNRPLVEEYTGLWCGYCPRGYIALEEMGEEYGDDFVAIAYHNEDPMEVIPTYQYPIAQFVSELGFPASQVNRLGEDEDPYYDTMDHYKEVRQGIAPVNVDVTCEWTDDSRTKIKATASARFVETLEENPYRIGFALVADNLMNSSWRQSNYFSGETGLEGELWDIFTQGGSYIKNLVYNFVCVKQISMNGFADSLPESVELATPYDYEIEIDATDIVNTDGDSFINPDAKLRVVAYVVDQNTLRVANSAKSNAIGSMTEGVDGIGEDPAKTVSVEYYDLAGRRVSAPVSGVVIERAILSDGSVKTSKRIVR